MMNQSMGAPLPIGEYRQQDGGGNNREAALPAVSGELLTPVQEAEFIIPASDQRGHSRRSWFRLQPGLARQVEMVMNAKVFPYRSPGDLVRHALTRHVQWLSTLASVPSVIAQVDLINDILRDEQFQEEFMLVMDKIEARVAGYLAAGRLPAARRLLQQVAEHIEQMPPGEWQDRYRDELEKKFAHLGYREV